MDAGRPGPVDAVPILRMFDADHAERFYLDYLGFEVEFAHRFEPDLPLYLRVRRGAAVLDLSEHHGDGTPGTAVWLATHDVEGYLAELRSRPHPRMRPGLDRDAPGGPTFEVVDPSGNTLRFCGVD